MLSHHVFISLIPKNRQASSVRQVFIFQKSQEPQKWLILLLKKHYQKRNSKFLLNFFLTPKRSKLVLSWEKGHFLKFQLEKRLKKFIQDYVCILEKPFFVNYVLSNEIFTSLFIKRASFLRKNAHTNAYNIDASYCLVIEFTSITDVRLSRYNCIFSLKLFRSSLCLLPFSMFLTQKGI